MDTNVDALKNLYTALGGSSDTVAAMTTNADVINAIAELDIGGGGGSTDFVITVTWENNDFVADKTYDEIISAYDSGTPIKLIVQDPSSSSMKTCYYDIRDFQILRQTYNYSNGLSITAILPYRLSTTDDIKKAALNVFCLSAYNRVDEGKSVSIELYKHTYTIEDNNSVSGTYEPLI